MQECINLWFKGALRIAIDTVSPMDAFRIGLAKIVNRHVNGKVVMIIESADWAATSPPTMYPPISLVGVPMGDSML